jgi:two-component system LytT family response regulator
MDKLSAVIIDDEAHCIKTLKWQLETYCPNIELKETFTSAKEGLDFLLTKTVDIVFLDIDMPVMNGFELLEKIVHPKFEVIFTTAHDQFALKAIKISALDYLIKPIDEEELVAAITKAQEKNQASSLDSISHLLGQIQQKSLSDRIYLPTLNGLEFVDTELINRCESDSNYTTIYLDQNEKITVSKTLKEIEEMLKEEQFFRVHNSHIVNLKKVGKYVKGDGGHLVMQGGDVIPVSRSRKQVLLDFLK